MNKNNFEGAEITVYTQSSNQFTFELSRTQIFIIFKILGFEFGAGSNYSCYSDETLSEFLTFKGNPLTLKKID